MNRVNHMSYDNLRHQKCSASQNFYYRKAADLKTMTERGKERPMPKTERSSALRCGTLLCMYATMSLVASCAAGDIVIEVSPDCGVALPGTSPTTRIQFSPSEDTGRQEILLRDSMGTEIAALLGYFNWGWKGNYAWEAQVACPGWIYHEIYHDGDAIVRCAPLRADGTVALIAREDGRFEEARVPVSEQRVVDLGSGHRVLINGFPNVGLIIEIWSVGGIDKSEVNLYGENLSNKHVPTDTPEVTVRMDGRTYCTFLDILTGQPRYLSAKIAK